MLAAGFDVQIEIERDPCAAGPARMRKGVAVTEKVPRWTRTRRPVALLEPSAPLLSLDPTKLVVSFSQFDRTQRIPPPLWARVREGGRRDIRLENSHSFEVPATPPHPAHPATKRGGSISHDPDRIQLHCMTTRLLATSSPPDRVGLHMPRRRGGLDQAVRSTKPRTAARATSRPRCSDGARAAPVRPASRRQSDPRSRARRAWQDAG